MYLGRKRTEASLASASKCAIMTFLYASILSVGVGVSSDIYLEWRVFDVAKGFDVLTRAGLLRRRAAAFASMVV
jgi:hypothetical protein